MEKFNIRKEKRIHYILGGILFVVLLYMIVGELFGPDDVPFNDGTCGDLQVAWERVYEDGTREQVELPGVWNAARGEKVRAEATLPANQADIWGCIRASQQDMQIFVGGELREEYSTKNTRLFGKTSASVYVFFPLYEADAGKVLAVETVSDSVYSGRMNQVIVGEKTDIMNRFLRENNLILIVAFTTVIFSVITVAASLILRVIHKKELDIIYLGLGTLLTSLIMLTESLLRQFFLPNITVASNMGFFLTMLAPYPFVIYVNLLQEQRYRKFYTPILIGVIVNFLGSTVLHVLGIVDLLDSMTIDYVIIVLALIVGMGTIITDIRYKRIREYWEVAIGIVGIILASVWEIYQVYYPGVKGGGFAFCSGLCFLLVMAALKTGRDMQALEKEKQRAVVAGEAKAQFLAQMSHEIRTPINTIIGMNEMILRENGDSSVREYAENIRSSSRVLMGLINDVLDFSKIEAGKMDISETTYSLKRMLEDLVQETRFKAEAKQLQMYTEFATSLPEKLYGDELRVRQILSNLLSNSVKYTHDGWVTLSVGGDFAEGVFTLCASVKDTGIGIRKGDIDHLFDSFQRLEERKHGHIEGTGLGLAITKQLVELMGGSIQVESEYGKGSCFSVRIPQQPVHDAEEAPVEENSAAKQEKKPEKKLLTAPEALVLAVDDNAMNLAVVKALLKRTGIQVETAPGGRECLEICGQKKFDLILMDHMMPELDGIETLHILRKEQGPNRDTKMLVLTANAIAGMAELYEKEGFAGYLTKPLVWEELEAMLGEQLPAEKVQWMDAE